MIHLLNTKEKAIEILESYLLLEDSKERNQIISRQNHIISLYDIHSQKLFLYMELNEKYPRFSSSRNIAIEAYTSLNEFTLHINEQQQRNEVIYSFLVF